MALLAELYSTLRLNRRRPLADNVTTHNAFLKQLERKSGIKEAGGGRELHELLIYGTYSNIKYYDGYETFAVDTSESVASGATFQWKQLGGFTFISGKEEQMHRGKEAAVDLLTTKDKALVAGLRNTMAGDLYSDGTGSGGKEFGGLQLLVADDPTASTEIGGLNQNTYTWWRNQSSVAASAISASNIQTKMNDMYLNCIRGTDEPDLILADLNLYKAYWESLQAIQRITAADKGMAGFKTLDFMGAPVVYDSQAPSQRMYFLNCDYLIFRKSGRFFTDEDPQQIQSADYTLFPNWTMGNLTCNNRSLQGVIGDSS